MTMRNKTTNIYTEWLPLVETLPNEIAGVIFKNILKYQNGEDIKSDFPVWMFIKSKIDEYNSKLDEIREKRKKSGSCGGLAKASKCYQMLASDSKCSNKTKENKIKQNKIKENNYNKYGELKNVCLIEEDYNKLLSIYPNLNEAIEVLDTWLGTSGSKNKNKNHYAYFKSNSWVWDRVENKKTSIIPKKEQTVFIEDGKFFIDDTMQEYKDVLVGMDDISVENCWKWIYNNFYGQEVSVEFIRERLKQFKRTEE